MNFSVEWLMQAGLRATLLLAGLFMVWRFLPASRPALRRSVLLAAAAVLLAAPWLTGWWGVHPTGAGISVPQNPDKILPFPWARFAAWLWLGGTSIAGARLLLEIRAMHRLIRHARPWSGSPALPELTVLQSSAISGPCVARGRRPVLLLPDSAGDWTPSQWQMILAHERQHLAQQDLPLSWLPRLVHCFYWWHPLAHWLKRQFHTESEALCDRAVLARSGHSARDYVEFLLSLNAARMPALAAGMALTFPLGQRIERLLLTRHHPARWWAGGAALLVLTGFAALSLSLRTVPPPVPHLAGPAPAGLSAPAPQPDPEPDETTLRLTANPFPQE